MVTGAGEAFSDAKMLEIWDFRFRKTAPRSRKRAPTAKILFFREGRAPGAHVEHRCGTPHSFLVVAGGELFLVPNWTILTVFGQQKHHLSRE